MPDITGLTFAGNVGIIKRDDGSIVRMIPATVNQWLPDGGRLYPTPPPPSGSPTITITGAMIEAAVNSAGGSLAAMIDTSDNIAAMFNDAVAKSYPDILSSKNRVACLVGECAQETDWYKTTTEYGTGQSYAPYIGRGFIQLTFSSNYADFGAWMKQIGLLTDSNYFVDNPTALSDKKWAAFTAIYYFTQKIWNSQNLFEICDTSSTPWANVSRAINRGDPASTSPAYGEAARTAAIDAVLAVTPDPTAPTPQTGTQQALATWMTDHLDAFRYSQQSPQRLDPVTYGQTDCSGLTYYVYKTVANTNIGTWTGTHDNGQQQYGTLIQTGVHGEAPNEANLVVGDLIFFNWDSTNTVMDHVDMYIGNNQVCGHGGPDMGPNIKTMNTRCQAAYNWAVRRYI